MRITGGITVEVHRGDAPRDRFGDTERDLVGTIENCVFQWASAAGVQVRFANSNDFRETAELRAVLFAPNDDPIQIQGKDRLKFNGQWYQVTGSRSWDEAHPMTGYDYGYYQVQVETVG